MQMGVRARNWPSAIRAHRLIRLFNLVMSSVHPGRFQERRRKGFAAAAALLFLCGAIDVAAQEPELKVGTTVERPLAGGQAHEYRIALPVQQYLYAVIDQEGIDVEVSLIAPDGKPVVHMDSANGAWGPEPIAAISQTGGEYRLRVVSPTAGAAPGKYRLRIEAMREPTPADREHVVANRAVEEALTLWGQGTAASLKPAAEKLRQALPIYHSAGLRYDEALAFYTLGIVQAQSGDFRGALQSYAACLPIFELLGDRAMQGNTLVNSGGAYDVLGDVTKALEQYDQALPLIRAGHDRLGEGSTLNNIGKIHGEMAEWQKANDYYRQALAIFRETGRHELEATALNNLGTNSYYLGEYERALNYFHDALPLYKSAHDPREANVLVRIGNVRVAKGELQEAEPYYQEALQLQSKAGDGWGQGNTLRMLAAATATAGDTGKALQQLQQAQQLLQNAGDRRGQALVLTALGQTYARREERQRSLEAYEKALPILQALGDRAYAATTLLGVARLERDENKVGEARKHAEEALTLVEQLRSHAGAEEDRASYFATQQSMGEFYIDLLMRMHQQTPNAGYDAEAFNAAERARARSLLEMLAETRVDFRQGVDPRLLQRERELSGLLNSKSQKLLTLRGAGTDEKAASLKKEISDLEGEYQQVELAIRKSSPEYAAITQPQPLTLKEVQQQVLDKDSLLLEYSLGDERSYLFVVSPDGLKTYDLPARAEIDKAVRSVYQLLTARSQYKMGETAPEKQARIARADREFPAAAAALSRMVLAPAAPELSKNNKRLVLVTDGSLQTVPFAVVPMPDGNAYAPLIAQHELVSLPSASTVAELRKQIAGRQPAPGLLAVFADPVFGAGDPRVHKSRIGSPNQETIAAANPPKAGQDESRMLEHLASGASTTISGRLEVPRLPFTREEATRIAKMVPVSETFEALDFRASLPTVTSETLSKYRYLHFATHGYMDSERPELSSIVLSLVDQNGNPQDGFLRAQDIYNLKLNADLVVLSACQTGLGKEIRGEGIVGLTRGFMYAGAPRVIVSMWSVNDRATEELMGAFYERLLKRAMRPSAALREAQLELSRNKKWSAPYYWGAFVQQGEWR
jgi:CHAT domain-containing protein/Tfp pilus assembly protein PilF